MLSPLELSEIDIFVCYQPKTEKRHLPFDDFLLDLTTHWYSQTCKPFLQEILLISQVIILFYETHSSHNKILTESYQLIVQ